MCRACQEQYRTEQKRMYEERGRAVVARQSHKLEAEGSNPSPATNDCKHAPEYGRDGLECTRCIRLVQPVFSDQRVVGFKSDCDYCEKIGRTCGPCHVEEKLESQPDYGYGHGDLFRSVYEDYSMCWICAHPRMIGRTECASERCACPGCHLKVEIKASMGESWNPMNDYLRDMVMGGDLVVMIPRNHGRTNMMKQLEIMRQYIPRALGEWTTTAKERRSSDEEHSPVTREVTGSSPAGAANNPVLMRPSSALVEWWIQEFDRRSKAHWTAQWREDVKSELEPFWKDNYGRTYATVQDITTEHLKNITLYLESRMRQARPNHGLKYYSKWLAVRNEIRARESAHKFEDELKGSPFGEPGQANCGSCESCNCQGERASEAVEPPKLQREGSTPSATANDVEDESIPDFLIGWSDDETAIEDLTAIVEREYERQFEFGMYPDPKDIATALVQSFREDEPEHDEIPGVDREMFSPWRKDEHGRVDGIA